MPEESTQRVIDAVCQAFEVRPEDLAVLEPRDLRRTWARAACALLARRAAGVSVQAMGRAIGYARPHLNNLNRQGRVWLRWAALEEAPPRHREVKDFRRLFEKACHKLSVDAAEIAAET